MASPFLLAAGGFTQGLAQGAQAGASMAYQYQSMQLQKQQMAIQATQGMVNALKIPNPAMRQYAVGKMMPAYGMDPNSPDGKNFLTAVNKADDAMIQRLQQGFAAAGITMSPDMVGQMWRQAPDQAINMLFQFSMTKQANEVMNASTSDTGQAGNTDVNSGTVQPIAGGTTGGTAGGGTDQTTTAAPAVAPAAAPPTRPIQQQPAQQAQPTQQPSAQPAAQPAQQPIRTTSSLAHPTLQFDKSGMPMPFDANNDPVVAKLNAGIQHLAAYPGDYAKNQKDYLQKRLDEYTKSMTDQYGEWIQQIQAKVALGHLSIDAAQLQLNQARFNWEKSLPQSPGGKDIYDYNRGKFDLQPGGGVTAGGGATGGGVGGGTGGGTAAVAQTGGGTAAAASTGTSQQPATGQAPAAPLAQTTTAVDPNNPYQARPTEFDETAGRQAAPVDVVRRFHPEANPVVGPDGRTVYQLNTPETYEDPKARDDTKKNLNANAAALNITNYVLDTAANHPDRLATGGEIKGIVQTVGSVAHNLVHVLTPSTWDPTTDAIYHKLFDYDPKIPALVALNHQLDFLVAMQLRNSSAGGGAGMMGMEDAMKTAEGMVGDWDTMLTSPDKIAANMNVVKDFLQNNIADNMSHLQTNTYADPLTKVFQPKTSASTGGSTQGQAQTQTSPTQNEATQQGQLKPVSIPWQQIPDTGMSVYKNMGGQNPSQYIPNNFLKILLHNPNPNARAYFNLNFGDGADKRVIGN